MSELEVDERLHLGADELVDDEDGEDADKAHDGQGKGSKSKAIAPLTVLWQPVDYHTNDKEKEDVAIGADNRPLVACPTRPDARHHLAGCLPSLLVGSRRVEVAARAEEEPREGDEGEGDEDGPGSVKERKIRRCP